MTDWQDIAVKVSKVFVAGGLGAIIAWLTGLPAEPTIIFTIAILKAGQTYATEKGWFG